MTDDRDDETPVVKVTDKRRFADLSEVPGAGERPAPTLETPPRRSTTPLPRDGRG